MQRIELIEKIKQLKDAYPADKWFKRGKVYFLKNGSPVELPNSVFLLEGGQVLITSTTGLKPPGIFDEPGYLGKGGFSKKVKAGLLFSPDFLSCDEVAVKKFLAKSTAAERKAEAAINHKMYGIGIAVQTEKHKLLVMKNLKGHSLEVVFKSAELDNEKKLSLMAKTFEALDNFHKKGFSHCDVALRNFVYSEEEDKVYIVDFGLALDKSTKQYSPAKDIGAAGRMLIDALKLSVEIINDDDSTPWLYRLASFMLKGEEGLLSATLPLADAIASLKQGKLVTEATLARCCGEEKTADMSAAALPEVQKVGPSISMYSVVSKSIFRRKKPVVELKKEEVLNTEKPLKVENPLGPT